MDTTKEENSDTEYLFYLAERAAEAIVKRSTSAGNDIKAIKYALVALVNEAVRFANDADNEC